METLRCTNCGSNRITILNEHICECQSCNSRIIMPKQQNNETINLLNMAYIFRSRYDYDSAIETYKLILEKDENELSAYEGLLLAKYGIEYVFDQRTNRYIPTCHRANFKSIYEDREYQNYLLKCNTEERAVIEQKAREIDNLQKQIKRQIENEKNYDVFISYKATDENGNPTLDGVMARDIYDELKSRKLNVFFSEVELRNRLATNYEPIIFHALQTAKIFILVGTKKEYVDSVWVKNEWSRFFERMEDPQDVVNKHSYIPVFKNMSPYDMPKGNTLQGIDANQIGWVKRLGDGVDSLLGRTEQDHIENDLNKIQLELENKLKSQVEEMKKSSQIVNANSNTSKIDNFLKRVKLYIEENNIAEAKNYIKKILDEDVEHSEAWLLSEIIQLGLKKEEDLTNYEQRLIGQDKEMVYAIKYAKGDQKDRYQKYVENIKTRYLSKKIPEYTKEFVTALRNNELDKAVTASKNIYNLDETNTVGLFCKSFDSEQYLKNKEEFINTKKQYEEEYKTALKNYQDGLKRDEEEEYKRKREIRELEEQIKRDEERYGKSDATSNAYLHHLNMSLGISKQYTRTKPVEKKISKSDIYKKLPENNVKVKEAYFRSIVNFYNNKKVDSIIVNEIHGYFYDCIREDINLFELLPEVEKNIEINKYLKVILKNNSSETLENTINKLKSLNKDQLIEFIKENKIQEIEIIEDHKLQLQNKIFKMITEKELLEISSDWLWSLEKYQEYLSSCDEKLNFLPKVLLDEIKAEVTGKISRKKEYETKRKKEDKKRKKENTKNKIIKTIDIISVVVAILGILCIVLGFTYAGITGQSYESPMVNFITKFIFNSNEDLADNISHIVYAIIVVIGFFITLIRNENCDYKLPEFLITCKIVLYFVSAFFVLIIWWVS